jgi:hypothetical protein
MHCLRGILFLFVFKWVKITQNHSLFSNLKKPKISPNLIKQNQRVCGRTKDCSKAFIVRDDIHILVLFTDTIKAKRWIFIFEESNKILFKNGLFVWATVPHRKLTLSLMVLD